MHPRTHRQDPVGSTGFPRIGTQQGLPFPEKGTLQPGP